jgi:hypothetical protein
VHRWGPMYEQKERRSAVTPSQEVLLSACDLGLSLSASSQGRSTVFHVMLP